MTSKCLQNDFKMTSKWLQNDFKITSKWLQNDFKMTSKWLQNDYDPVVHTAHRSKTPIYITRAQMPRGSWIILISSINWSTLWPSGF